MLNLFGDRRLRRHASLTSVLAAHHTTVAAIRRKLYALAVRTEPQARDVSTSRCCWRAPTPWASRSIRRPGTIEHVMGLSFDDYASKVVAYLELSHAEFYAGRDAWEAMQEDVIVRLEALR